MFIMYIYTLYDTVAEECGPLFEAKNDKLALRIFQNMKFPPELNKKDFHLYKLGQCDKEQIRITSMNATRIFINMEDFKDEEDEI